VAKQWFNAIHHAVWLCVVSDLSQLSQSSRSLGYFIECLAVVGKGAQSIKKLAPSCNLGFVKVHQIIDVFRGIKPIVLSALAVTQ
jgi:hypothetical protein